MASENEETEYIKSLERYTNPNYMNNKLITEIAPPDTWETLNLTRCWYQRDIELKIDQCPNIRSLSLTRMVHRKNAEILTILRKCKQLESFVIDSGQSSAIPSEHEDIDVNDYLMNLEFHEEFVKAAHHPNIKMEIKNEGQTVGIVTKHEIIWRNKLIHWVGHDPALSQSNVQLLDLATIPKDTKAKHKQPLNLIFNYLDLNSLYTFCMVNKECKQLVHNYIYQRCVQNTKYRSKHRPLEREKLVLTDEFFINYNALRLFGKCITNLEVNLYNYRTQRLEDDIRKYCKKMQYFCLRVRYRRDPHCFTFPNLKHYVFYGYAKGECIYHCDMNDLAYKSPNLETIEFRTPIKLYYGWFPKQIYSFKNLKKFKFKPFDREQVVFAKKHFENTCTEVIVD